MDNNANSEITNIKNAANIVDIISNYVPLESHGKNYFGVCPFHDDHSPSMSVSPDKQIYKCFVCGATGNVFNFVENYLSISFLEAVKTVADQIGANFVIRENRQDVKNQKYYDIMNLATLFYQNNLRTKVGEEARKYLHERGLTDEIIKDFSIGLSLEENDALYKLLSKKNIPDKDMKDVGLIGISDRGVYDLFRNRIMFPLFSPTGKVNGYSARIYNSSSNSKYINTTSTVIFTKGENLYNYHLAAPVARQEKYIVICEGQMDAIRIYSIGIKNVVATMGTALTKEQIALLKKLNAKVIITMDNDNAGEIATVSLGRSLLSEGVDIGVVRLTGKKDPDDYILTYGALAFKDNIKNPISYPEFMESYLRKNKNLSNPSELTQYINEIIEMVQSFNDEILVEVTLNKIADEFHLDKELLKSRVKAKEKIEDVKVTNTLVSEENIEKKRDKFNKALVTMLYYMMNDTDCMRMFLHYQLKLPKSKYRLVANNLIYYFELNREIDFGDYLVFCEAYPEVSEVVKEILKSVHIDEFKIEDMEAIVKKVKSTLDKERIKEIQSEIKVELDVNRKKRLLDEIVEIKKGSVTDGRD